MAVLSRKDCVSNRNMKILDSFAMTIFGDNGGIFEGLPYPEEEYTTVDEYFTDENQWSIYKYYEIPYRRLRSLTGDPNIYAKCGASVAKLKSWGAFQDFVTALRGPLAALAMIQIFNQSFNDMKDFHFIESPHFDKQVKKILSTMLLRFHDDQDPHKDYISDPQIKNIISAIPEAWGLEKAVVTQPVVPYDVERLFNEEKEFKDLKLDVTTDDHHAFMSDPNTQQRVKFGDKVIFVPETFNGKDLIIAGEKVYRGKWKPLNVSSHKELERQLVGVKTTTSIVHDELRLFEEGILYGTGNTFTITFESDKISTAKSFFYPLFFKYGKKDQLQGMQRSLIAVRKAIKDKNKLLQIEKKLTEELTKHKRNLERLVSKRTIDLKRTNEELQETLEELREAQRDLIHTAKMSSLGTLAAGIAHEINNGITAIDRSIGAMASFKEEIDSSYNVINEYIPSVNLLDISDLGKKLYNLGLTQLPISKKEERKIADDIGKVLKHEGIELGAMDRKKLASFGYDAESVKEIMWIIGNDEIHEILKYLNSHYQYGLTTQNANIGKERIKKIVNAIKEFSHVEGEETSEMDVNKQLRSTLFLMHNELKYGINVHTRLKKDLIHPKVNVAEINQVFHNIFTNAVQAMCGTGDLTVETYMTKESSKEYVVTKISDSGPGIDEKDIDRVFEPMFTTKDVGEGTGIGLSLAERYVHTQNGQIRAYNQKEGGATFEVLLPV